MKVLIENIDLAAGMNDANLEEEASRIFQADLKLYKILRKSIDARKRGRPIVKYRAVFDASDKDYARLLRSGCLQFEEMPLAKIEKSAKKESVVIIGSGPAGLFAALRLAERGIKSTILERGKNVSERHADVLRLKKDGVLNTESNVVFGEGGAGTYSDGKLTTRIHREGIDWVFSKLVEHGAPENILFDAKPHIGTDVLSRVVVSVRKKLQDFGCEVCFGEKAVEIISKNGIAVAVRCASGKEFSADHIVVACGNSARDFFANLEACGVTIEKKGLAVGVRIEHPADFISRAQYGDKHSKLPAADYRLAFNNKSSGRGTYSFCMCPGGEVINSSSEQAMLCVNGMSYSRRDGKFSNAAIVVSVSPSDFDVSPLAGIEFQRKIEAVAFKAGGGAFASPASSALRFVTGKDKKFGGVSYEPRCVEADFHDFLPKFVAGELKLALLDFDKRMKGFISEGVLIGVETRTSSPVRICRGDDFQSVSMKRLYPAGEGAGYAGGIISSAVDGLRVADQIAGF